MTQETKNLAKKENQNVELPQDRPVFVPATDIYETEKAIFLRCSMPGVRSGLPAISPSEQESG